MYNEIILQIQQEIEKAVKGKTYVIQTILKAILAGGHILLEDIPGVGKTTLSLAFSRALGLEFKRVQFTPDVVPSDITGFTMYNQQTGKFVYRKGAAMCNFLLADEINRTSSKTQSALLEVIQEGRMTVDGYTYEVPKPFVVMATENPLGTAGTQMLPEAQLDRFMIQLSIGYPDSDAQVEILKNREMGDPLDNVYGVITSEELIYLIEDVRRTYTDDKVYRYITDICEASRVDPNIRLGLSPRGAQALHDMARSNAYMNYREYVIPQDVRDVFKHIARHRLILSQTARLSDVSADEVMDELIASVPEPNVAYQ